VSGTLAPAYFNQMDFVFGDVSILTPYWGAKTKYSSRPGFCVGGYYV